MENTIFAIVGSGSYLDTLEDLAFAENISDKVIFTGAVEPENIAAYYRLGDIFLSVRQKALFKPKFKQCAVHYAMILHRCNYMCS